MDNKKEIAKIINEIFKRLKGIYPAWRSAFKSEEELANMKREWTIGLYESNIRTSEQIALGLKNCRKQNSPFFPSIGEFIQFCTPTPEQLKIPNVDRSYKRACQYASQRQAGLYPPCHPVTYRAAKAVGFHELRTVTNQAVMFARYKRAYTEAIEEYIAGVDLVSPMPEPLRVKFEEKVLKEGIVVPLITHQ